MNSIKVFSGVLKYNCKRLLVKCVYSKCIRNLHYDITTKSKVWTQPVGYNTGVRIYNPIVKQKVDLILKNKDIATWYSCGPTVYDSAHIGHASCYVRFDIIRRILKDWFNIDVIMVMGVTDIDDKIIKRSQELDKDVLSVSKKYEMEFFSDLDGLNVLRPSLIVKVTAHITNIIDFINKIVLEGYAYAVPSGSVYFSTSKYGGYNKFGSASSMENSTQDIDSSKRSSLDFALWKSAKPGEPYWESPWGVGRPGWHIECSAMASAIFGDNIDIHSGGIDLKFPHHENEEAQSCAHHGTDQWINYWIHSGHLHLEGEKMSKSLKNTTTIGEHLKKYSANEFRTLCLMSPYRSSIDYNDNVMKTASNVWKKVESFQHTCDAYLNGIINRGSVQEDVVLKELEKTKRDVQLALSDDFDTPKALSSLLELISMTNTMINDQTENVNRSPFAVATVSNYVVDVFGKWGMDLNRLHKEVLDDSSIKLSHVLNVTVDFRSSVREILQSVNKTCTSDDTKKLKKDLYKCSDDLRRSLSEIGVQLEDHKGKTSWKLKDCTIKEDSHT